MEVKYNVEIKEFDLNKKELAVILATKMFEIIKKFEKDSSDILFFK